MTDPNDHLATHRNLPARFVLIALLLHAAIISTVGITWGLPSRAVDPYLFGDHEIWTGEQISKLAGGWTDDPTRGADVDIDPLQSRTQPVVLNATDAQRAEIIRRYRLYTYQPDEMITMRALANMRPSQGKLDPRLYQYGGLWIYPVGALLKLASMAKLITLRSDVPWYLDHPEEFGKFYVIARAYSAAWGLVGLCAVFWIVRRLTNGSLLPAVFAGLCYIAMPIIINMGHEAKPHLPGAVLQLLAIAAAMKYVETSKSKWRIATAVLCGCAFGMVLSAWPVFIVLPAMELLRVIQQSERLGHAFIRTIIFTFIGVGVYLFTNPYIVINLFINRAVLHSNFGNSLAMYEIGRWQEGIINAAKLVAEGSSSAIAICGTIGFFITLVSALRHCTRNNNHDQALSEKSPSSPTNGPEGAQVNSTGLQPCVTSAPKTNIALKGRRNTVADLTILATPALLILIQFIALAAGKPGEYGRFAVVLDVVFVITSIGGIYDALPWRVLRIGSWLILFVIICYSGIAYERSFLADTREMTSRLEAAEKLHLLNWEHASRLGVYADPAPYLMPPVDLFNWQILLGPKGYQFGATEVDVIIQAADNPLHLSPPVKDYAQQNGEWDKPYCEISWANKPIVIWAGYWVDRLINVLRRNEPTSQSF